MKNICLFLSAAVLIASCTKDLVDETASPIVPNVAVADYAQFEVTSAKLSPASKFLKREVYFFSPNPSLKSVRIFSYDAVNRCTEIKLGTIDSSQANPVFNLKQTLTFVYGSNSVLPDKFASVRTVFPNLITIFYYSYNVQGLKTKDSVMVKNTAGDPASRVINYVYENGKVHTTPVLSGFSYENIPFDTLSVLQNGNIEKLVSRLNKASGDQIAIYTFTYDKYISPYNKLNIANSLYFENSAIGLGYNVPLETHYMGVTFNNMTSWSSGTYKVTFKYVYTADKYPVKKEMFLPGDANAYQVTYFEY